MRGFNFAKRLTICLLLLSLYVYLFLAHLRDEVSQGELLWSLCVRRPSVRPSVNFCFKSLLLSSQLSNSIETSQESQGQIM